MLEVGAKQKAKCYDVSIGK